MEALESPRRCIYCFNDDQSQLSKSHLFPECIGGKLFDYYSCRACNSTIGSEIESLVKQTLFFCFGLLAMGVEREDAMKHIKIRDQKTGDILIPEGDRLYGQARKPIDGRRIAPPKAMRRLFRKDIRKRLPNWERAAMEMYDAANGHIRLSNESHRFHEETMRTTVEYQGGVSFPFELLAKLAYEAICCFGQFNQSALDSFYKSTFKVKREGSKKSRISIANDFRFRVFRIRPELLRSGVDFEKLNYEKYHRLDFRVSEQGVGYVWIEFFGLLPFIVAVGKVRRENCGNTELLGKALFFPIDRDVFHPSEYPANFGDQLFVDGSRAELMYARYENGGLPGMDWPIDSEKT